MTTHVERARVRVEREREAVGEKRTAYDRFRSRIGSMSPRAAAPRRTAVDGAGETLVSVPTGRCPVREAFVETVAPTCEDRPTAALLEDELGADVARALATGGASPALRRAIRSETDRRRAELAAMDGALEAEAASLARANETVEPIREWLIEANGTPLSERGFEGLRARHERLAGFREDCDALVRDRQARLTRTTGSDGKAGVRHRDLLAYLYDDFPVDHPVLVTATRLDDLCAECQRVVRDHLVRRA